MFRKSFSYLWSAQFPFGRINHFDYMHQHAKNDQHAEHYGHVDDGNQKRIAGYRTHSFHLFTF